MTASDIYVLIVKNLYVGIHIPNYQWPWNISAEYVLQHFWNFFGFHAQEKPKIHPILLFCPHLCQIKKKWLFCYHEDRSKKLNACCLCISGMIYFFTWTQRFCYVTDYVLQYLHDNQCLIQPNPLASHQPVFTYLENQLLCSWWWIPFCPGPWSANNCPHPLLVLSPFHTLQFRLHYLHRWHQQHQSSSSGTIIILSFEKCANIHELRSLTYYGYISQWLPTYIHS